MLSTNSLIQNDAHRSRKTKCIGGGGGGGVGGVGGCQAPANGISIYIYIYIYNVPKLLGIFNYLERECFIVNATLINLYFNDCGTTHMHLKFKHHI